MMRSKDIEGISGSQQSSHSSLERWLCGCVLCNYPLNCIWCFMHSFLCIISFLSHSLRFPCFLYTMLRTFRGQTLFLMEKEIDYIKYLNTVKNKQFMYMVAQIGKL